MVETGYAKDGVPIIDYPVNPTVYGTSTTAPYSSHQRRRRRSGGSDGWLPGDPNTVPTPARTLTNISNADNGGGAASTAYRLWCATDSTRITDWGALTNLGPNLEIPDVSVTSGSTTVTLASWCPSSASPRGEPSRVPDIPAGTTITSSVAVGPR